MKPTLFMLLLESKPRTEYCRQCGQPLEQGQLVTSNFLEHIHCPEYANYAPADVPVGYYELTTTL
jgi:hypothetical protein